MFYPNKGYLYPDGTYASRKPGDGELFHLTDSNGNTTSSWQFDSVMDHWVNISSGKYTSKNTGTFVVPQNAAYLVLGGGGGGGSGKSLSELGLLDPPVLKCGCGSASVKSARHSDYCDLYDPRA